MESGVQQTSDKTRLLDAEEGASSVGGGYADRRLEAGVAMQQTVSTSGYEQAYPLQGQLSNGYERPTYVVGMNAGGQTFVPAAEAQVPFYPPLPQPQPIIYGQVRTDSDGPICGRMICP